MVRFRNTNSTSFKDTQHVQWRTTVFHVASSIFNELHTFIFSNDLHNFELSNDTHTFTFIDNQVNFIKDETTRVINSNLGQNMLFLVNNLKNTLM